MNLENNLPNCNKDIKPNRCPKIIFVLPTGATGGNGTLGPTGPIGESPVLTIGTVTTGNPGTQASATITGTSPNFILNLTIPQGPTGPTGSST